LLLREGADSRLKPNEIFRLRNSPGARKIISNILQHGFWTEDWSYAEWVNFLTRTCKEASKAGDMKTVETIFIKAESNNQMYDAVVGAALEGAVEASSLKAIRLILDRANVSDRNYAMALISALRKNQPPIIEFFSKVCSNQEALSIAVTMAARQGKMEIVEILVQNGARAESEEALLALAVASRAGYQKIVELLLSAGGDLEKAQKLYSAEETHRQASNQKIEHEIKKREQEAEEWKKRREEYQDRQWWRRHQLERRAARIVGDEDGMDVW
jgi:hypothetical protein